MMDMNATMPQKGPFILLKLIRLGMDPWMDGCVPELMGIFKLINT